MPRKVLIAITPAMLAQVDLVAQAEHRSRSDLIRESLRRYLDAFRKARIEQPILPLSTIELNA